MLWSLLLQHPLTMWFIFSSMLRTEVNNKCILLNFKGFQSPHHCSYKPNFYDKSLVIPCPETHPALHALPSQGLCQYLFFKQGLLVLYINSSINVPMYFVTISLLCNKTVHIGKCFVLKVNKILSSSSRWGGFQYLQHNSGNTNDKYTV